MPRSRPRSPIHAHGRNRERESGQAARWMSAGTDMATSSVDRRARLARAGRAAVERASAGCPARRLDRDRDRGYGRRRSDGDASARFSGDGGSTGVRSAGGGQAAGGAGRCWRCDAEPTVSVDELMEGLWGEQAAGDRGEDGEQYVSQLRKLLATGRGGDRHPWPGLRAADRRRRGRRARFERLVGARGRAREALALWRGPPLADMAEEPFAGGGGPPPRGDMVRRYGASDRDGARGRRAQGAGGGA